jgi:hypothetical protein
VSAAAPGIASGAGDSPVVVAGTRASGSTSVAGWQLVNAMMSRKIKNKIR